MSPLGNAVPINAPITAVTLFLWPHQNGLPCNKSFSTMGGSLLTGVRSGYWADGKIVFFDFGKSIYDIEFSV